MGLEVSSWGGEEGAAGEGEEGDGESRRAKRCIEARKACMLPGRGAGGPAGSAIAVSLLEGEPEAVEVEVQVEVEVEMEQVLVVARDSLEHEDSLSRRLRDTTWNEGRGQGRG